MHVHQKTADRAVVMHVHQKTAERPFVVHVHQLLLALLCVAFSGGCVSWQTQAGPRLPTEERVVLPSRGQLRVIERNATAPETVLLVHGYGASSASYGPVLEELATRFHVLAVDLPGFGASDRREGDYSPAALADDLAAILDKKGVARAHVVGHSWGSSVALAFAMGHADRLVKLVVISGWVYDEQLFPLMRWAKAPLLGDALYALFYRQAIGERMLLNFRDPTLVTQKVVDEVERQMSRPGSTAAALAAARGMRFAEVEHGYRDVTADTLVLWGRDDRVARLAFGERLARELPYARLVVIPACGHVPMWECRHPTARALMDFLAPAEQAAR